jgi:hypothetical protein
MDTSPPSADLPAPAPGNTEEEEAAGDCCCFETVDSSVIMVGPSNDLQEPCHHHKKHSSASIPNSEMALHKSDTRSGGGKTGSTDVSDNHYTGHREAVMCRRKATSVNSVTDSLGVRHSQEDISRFNTSNRKGPNCATFYVKHHDMDSDHDMNRGDMAMAEQGRLADTKSVEDSSDDEWTYKQGNASPVRVNGASDGSGSSSEAASGVRRHSASKKSSVVMRLDFGSGAKNALNNNDLCSDMILNGKHESSNQVEEQQKKSKGSPGRQHERNSLEAIHRLVSQAEKMVREDASPEKMSAATKVAREFEPLVFSDAGKMSAASQAKYARIKQWLKLRLQDQTDAKSVLQVSCI